MVKACCKQTHLFQYNYKDVYGETRLALGVQCIEIIDFYGSVHDSDISRCHEVGPGEIVDFHGSVHDSDISRRHEVGPGADDGRGRGGRRWTCR
jgi:hypothetical protein